MQRFIAAMAAPSSSSSSSSSSSKTSTLGAVRQAGRRSTGGGAAAVTAAPGGTDPAAAMETSPPCAAVEASSCAALPLVLGSIASAPLKRKAYSYVELAQLSCGEMRNLRYAARIKAEEEAGEGAEKEAEEEAHPPCPVPRWATADIPVARVSVKDEARPSCPVPRRNPPRGLPLLPLPRVVKLQPPTPGAALRPYIPAAAPPGPQILGQQPQWRQACEPVNLPQQQLGPSRNALPQHPPTAAPAAAAVAAVAVAVPPQLLSMVQPRQQGENVRTSPRMQSSYQQRAGGAAAAAIPPTRPGRPAGGAAPAVPEVRPCWPAGGVAPVVAESKTVHIATIARGYHKLGRGVDRVRSL